MRTLSETLLAAQRAPSGTPYVRVTARNKTLGTVNLRWERLYTGSEPDFYHALTIPADGSLLRFRVAPVSDANKLYRQRVVNPGPGSSFSEWSYFDQYAVLVVAAASFGSEVSVFWIKDDRSVYWQKSTDSGVSWDAPQLIDFSPSTLVYGIAAAYKNNGDLGLFYVEEDTLWVKKRLGGVWQDKFAWDKVTGSLSGVASVYDGDWNLLISGRDAGGDYRVWSLVYGDGGDVASGVWSELMEMVGAPSGGSFEYKQISLVKADVYRAFFTEKFSGTEAYNRPFWSNTVSGTRFLDNAFREAVPFNALSEYGLAVAGYGDYLWLSMPAGVWCTVLAEETCELTPDVTSLRYELSEGSGWATIELGNDDGRFNAPGSGNLKALDYGSELTLSPGYVTPAGNEVSEGLSFQIEAFEHISAGGKASLILRASDGWGCLKEWQARSHIRWNKSGSLSSVKDIMVFVLARAGLKLEVKSASTVVTGFSPDFTIQPGNRGDDVLRELLSFVPDVIFIEGNKAYLVNPGLADSPVYSYGDTHPVFEGRYRQGVWNTSRVQVEGFEPGSGASIVLNSFAWDEIEGADDRLTSIYDRNIDSVSKAQERGEAYLRQAEINSYRGLIRIPVNCGEQMYDVIEISDGRAGLSGSKRRVLGLSLNYRPRNGEYEERLRLGAV